jgi:hypothetical protein
MSETTQGGANITAVKKKIVELAKRMAKAKAARASANEEMGLIRAEAEEAGVPRKAFIRAVEYYEMDPEKREGYDEGYAISREALGVPIAEQLDMFSEDETDNEDEGGGSSDGRPTEEELTAAAANAAAEQEEGGTYLDGSVSEIKDKAKRSRSKAPPATIN